LEFPDFFHHDDLRLTFLKDMFFGYLASSNKIILPLDLSSRCSERITTERINRMIHLSGSPSALKSF